MHSNTVKTYIYDPDTSPLIMVVGGYDDLRPAVDPNSNKCYKDDTGSCKARRGLTNDVEILSLSSTMVGGKSLCSKFVSKVYGFSYILGEDNIGIIVENEAELLGLSGQFTKNAAIVCGGTNGDGDQAKCYEWQPYLNQYVFILNVKLRYKDQGFKNFWGHIQLRVPIFDIDGYREDIKKMECNR